MVLIIEFNLIFENIICAKSQFFGHFEHGDVLTVVAHILHTLHPLC